MRRKCFEKDIKLVVVKNTLLKKALEMGITYWDTALTYRKSEEGMGKYFLKYPEDRKKVFLVTKSPASSPVKMTRNLNSSLEKLRLLLCFEQETIAIDVINSKYNAFAFMLKIRYEATIYELLWIERISGIAGTNQLLTTKVSLSVTTLHKGVYNLHIELIL